MSATTITQEQVMKQKIKLLSVKSLKSGNKKYVAEFEITKPNGSIQKCKYSSNKDPVCEGN